MLAVFGFFWYTAKTFAAIIQSSPAVNNETWWISKLVSELPITILVVGAMWYMFREMRGFLRDRDETMKQQQERYQEIMRYHDDQFQTLMGMVVDRNVAAISAIAAELRATSAGIAQQHTVLQDLVERVDRMDRRRG